MKIFRVFAVFFSLLILLISTFSCYKSPPTPRAELYPYDVEIFCPSNGRRILIETTNRQQVIQSIEKFIAQKQAQGTDEKYTVLRFEDKSSLLIKGIPPEELIRCFIRDVQPEVVKGYYKF